MRGIGQVMMKTPQMAHMPLVISPMPDYQGKALKKAGTYSEKEYIFFWRRKKTEEEKEENIWRRKIDGD